MYLLKKLYTSALIKKSESISRNVKWPQNKYNGNKLIEFYSGRHCTLAGLCVWGCSLLARKEKSTSIQCQRHQPRTEIFSLIYNQKTEREFKENSHPTMGSRDSQSPIWVTSETAAGHLGPLPTRQVCVASGNKVRLCPRYHSLHPLPFRVKCHSVPLRANENSV